jgi:predicted MFS family arabinose efflux permease
MLHGVSFACSQIAAVEFIAQIMPNTYEASGQGLLLLVRGLGATSGLFFGGLVEDRIGGRGLYACLSGVVTIGLLIFGIPLAKGNEL